jgi:hypothetical protein
MIQPDEIRRRAESQYRPFLEAWLAGEDFFPLPIRADLRADPSDRAASAAAVRRLRAGSREVLGFGYTVEWRERNSRTFGRNEFPERILFETRDDYLHFIAKREEFAVFAP